MFSQKKTERLLLIVTKLLFLIAVSASRGFSSNGVYKRSLRKVGTEIALLQKEMEK